MIIRYPTYPLPTLKPNPTGTPKELKGHAGILWALTTRVLYRHYRSSYLIASTRSQTRHSNAPQLPRVWQRAKKRKIESRVTSASHRSKFQLTFPTRRQTKTALALSFTHGLTQRTPARYCISTAISSSSTSPAATTFLLPSLPQSLLCTRLNPPSSFGSFFLPSSG